MKSLRIFMVITAAVCATAATGAEPKTTHLDWEPACGGSSIAVTTVANQILLIEAYVEHFAEAREWICMFRSGAIVGATFRHYKVTRNRKGEEGEYEIMKSPDKIAIFAAHDGALEEIDEGDKKDLDTVIAIAKFSLGQKKP